MKMIVASTFYLLFATIIIHFKNLIYLLSKFVSFIYKANHKNAMIIIKNKIRISYYHLVLTWVKTALKNVVKFCDYFVDSYFFKLLSKHDHNINQELYKYWNFLDEELSVWFALFWSECSQLLSLQRFGLSTLQPSSGSSHHCTSWSSELNLLLSNPCF